MPVADMPLADMPFAAVTRLRVRRLRFLPVFLISAYRSIAQARRTEGCIAADMRTSGGRVFWTCSLWRDTDAMRRFMGSGVHRHAMSRLPDWCDEASLVHWQHDALPDWSEAEARLRQSGRLSRVRHPSPAQARGEVVPGG
jgi:hypothetical protein